MQGQNLSLTLCFFTTKNHHIFLFQSNKKRLSDFSESLLYYYLTRSLASCRYATIRTQQSPLRNKHKPSANSRQSRSYAGMRPINKQKKSQKSASTLWDILLICSAYCFRDYSTIEATLPEPTVRPPSRIANVRPCSIAIGWISSIDISTLSPGIHISVPAGKLHTPVTSVVLK